jgi:chemotaxis methyl-accepting protein methylase
MERREDLVSRRERYMTLNLKKEQGKSRIDKFFKKKNFEHTMTYRDKIKKEESLVSQKMDTIHKLAEI